MDLVYLYVGEIGRTIGHFGVEFSRRFHIEFDPTTGKLYISKRNEKSSKSSIYGSNIKDVDLIVGKNGSGKSTVLSLLGLSRTERLVEFPIHLDKRIATDDNNKLTWFILYYIDDDYFAIEGNWCDTLEFMRGDTFLHFQTLYSLYFKYDYELQTGNNVRHLQDFKLRKNKDFHKKLFYLYYDNPVRLDWISSEFRRSRNDMGSHSMFERVMCERRGYQGIVRYLYAANHEKDFMKLMGTKPGTVIKISVKDMYSFPESDVRYIKSASDIIFRDSTDHVSIDVRKAAEYVYGGKLSLIDSTPIEILRSFNKGESINNGLRFKEAFIIAYLEQIAIYCIMHQELGEGDKGNQTLIFPLQKKDDEQTQYDWQKWHLIRIAYELLGENDLDYLLTMGIVSGLEEIPERFFVSYTEMEIYPMEMEKNFLDSLMSSLDDNQIDDEYHEINHRYYLKTEFKGISNGEARMIDIFAMLYNSLGCCCHVKNDTCVLLLDEPDMGFHPEWSRIFIEKLTDFLKSKMMRNYNYHIIISSHSSIMLSDALPNCIHCISKDDSGKVTVKESDKYGLISGINDILIDDFFVDSVFGSFGEKYVNGIIQEIIKLEEKLVQENKDSDILTYCDEKCDEIADKIECLGAGYIKTSIKKRLNQLKKRIKA